MADDEQFSLCWNNFNTNLSAGFHESLCRGDLVDVTLAAEGQLVKAHRLVLSVCSPYFRKMFTTMPTNQHAFIFLKDVSHSALKDLIQFMYCGEVNVKQDALPAFISTAEALQIKGLTDGDPAPAQSPAKPSTPAHQQNLTTRVRQPTTRPQQTTSRSYKIETIEDSGDEVLSAGGKTTTQIVLQATPAPQTSQQTQQQNVVQTPTNQGATVVSQKRPAGQRSISSAQTKRIKTQTVVSVQQTDPLEAVGATDTTTIQTVQSVTAADKSDTEFIDLPIDLPTKSEPDYSNTEDAGDVDTAGEQETYVEDDSYGDMKYDESYFTENEDQNATTTPTPVTTSAPAIKQQFGETSYAEAGDQSGAEAQDIGNDFYNHKLLVKKVMSRITKRDPLSDQNDFIIPIYTVDEVFELNDSVNNEEYRQELVEKLKRHWNPDLRRCVKALFEKIMDYSVITRFSWTGKTATPGMTTRKEKFSKLDGVFELFVDFCNSGPLRYTDKVIVSEIQIFLKRANQTYRRMNKF